MSHSPIVYGLLLAVAVGGRVVGQDGPSVRTESVAIKIVQTEYGLETYDIELRPPVPLRGVCCVAYEALVMGLEQSVAGGQGTMELTLHLPPRSWPLGTRLQRPRSA